MKHKWKPFIKIINLGSQVRILDKAQSLCFFSLSVVLICAGIRRTA
jgi:hypothetical protein